MHPVRRRLIGTALMVAIASFGAPAEAGYAVTVTDCRTGRPIAGAVIIALSAHGAPGRPREVRTGREGYSEIYPAPPDRHHEFSITAPGYETRSRTVFVRSSGVTKESVCLNERTREADARARDLIAQPEAPPVVLPPTDSGSEADRAIGRLGQLIGQQPQAQAPPPGSSRGGDCEPPWGPSIPVQDTTQPKYSLLTDGGKTVTRKAGSPHSATTGENFAKHKGIVEKTGGYVVAEPAVGSNCHGYSFNRGDTFIEPAEVGPLILKDNYAEIMVASCAKAALCDVIVYGDKEADGTIAADHSGFVVELDANGKPALVVSKWGDGAGVFVHKPQHYKTATARTDYTFHRRRPPAKASDEVTKLEKEYKDAVDAKKDQKTLHALAIKLCQARNALTRAVSF